MCGYQWYNPNGTPNYQIVVHNCEDYISCLLSKCDLHSPIAGYECYLEHINTGYETYWPIEQPH